MSLTLKGQKSLIVSSEFNLLLPMKFELPIPSQCLKNILKKLFKYWQHIGNNEIFVPACGLTCLKAHSDKLRLTRAAVAEVCGAEK